MSASEPALARRAVVALGSNLGDRLGHLRGGVEALLATEGIALVAASPVYRTEPVGGPEQPDYYNAVLILETTLPARGLLARCQAVEAEFGRVRVTRWGSRTLDLDVIVYGDEVSDDPELTLPHPRAHERAFVLAPWHDADPGASIPGRGRVADLLHLTGQAGITRLDDVALRTAG